MILYLVFFFLKFLKKSVKGIYEPSEEGEYEEKDSWTMFLSVLCLNLSTTVFAEESQVVNSTEISETTSINSTDESSSSETTETSNSEQTIESTEEKVTVPETQIRNG